MSLCSLLEKFLPERQSYTEIFNATKAFLNVLVINNELNYFIPDADSAILSLLMPNS